MFSIFKKKKPFQPVTAGNSVPVEQVGKGSHGDHWGALIGFERMSKDASVMETIIKALALKGKRTWVEGDYYSRIIQSEKFSLKSIDSGRELVTAFPVIHSADSIPVNSKNIREWSHVGGVEAQVEGLGRNTFGLLFFATDYLENKSKYGSNDEIEVELSGIALSAGPAGKIDGFAEDFVGYIPNEKFKHFSIMSYVGKVISAVELVDNDFGIDGYYLILQLINNPEQVDFFEMPVFISKQNMQVPNIAAGDRISGDILLQGKLKSE